MRPCIFSLSAISAVVIGATVTGSGDVFPTPFDPVMPGVEIIATAKEAEEEEPSMGR